MNTAVLQLIPLTRLLSVTSYTHSPILLAGVTEQPGAAQCHIHIYCRKIVYEFDITTGNTGRQCDNTHSDLTTLTEDYMLPNAQTGDIKRESLFAVLNTLNRHLPKALRQAQIGNKHDVDDTRLENQRVAMENVR